MKLKLFTAKYAEDVEGARKRMVGSARGKNPRDPIRDYNQQCPREP